MAEKNALVNEGNRLASDSGFQNKTILIAGGSGFMGKVLIEKLLRTCPTVNRIYVLIRTKKGKSAKERLDELFKNQVFDLLKKIRGPEVLNKLIAINGDVAELGIGLSEKDRKILTDEVEIIFHLAATIRFDDPLKKAVLTNTRGTKMMLDLAKECAKLLVFVHVSTAYCHLEERILDEKPYPPPADPKTVIKMVEELEENIVETMNKKIIQGSPNTYAFTKALGEDLVVAEFDNVPVIILRPSVVIPALLEPIKGWTDNINGPAGLLIAAGKGVLRTMYCNSKGYADYLPVDIAANCILMTTYDYLTFKTRRIYNLTSSFEYKVTWAEIIYLGRKIVTTTTPFNWIVWYPGGSLKSSRFLHNISVILFHYIPAVFVDSLLMLTGNKPVLWKVQQRITKGFEIFEFYANNQWDFINDNGLTARANLNETERQIYKVDGDGVDIETYFTHCIHAARLFVLKEGDDTLPTAKVHLKVMWAVDRLTKLFMAIGFSYFILQYFTGISFFGN